MTEGQSTERRHRVHRVFRRASRFAWLMPVVLYLWGVLPSPKADGVDLHPMPDAQEYALIATRLAQFQPPLLEVGMQMHPSRYPLTHPILLVPFAWIFQFDMTRYFWASAFFGLVATLLIARTGIWLLGSRWAAALAASFWALHPETVHGALVNMSETGLVMMFMMMLETGRPWLENKGGRPGWPRAVALGVLLGWLTVTKVPFAYLAVFFGGIMLLRAVERREWGPLLGVTGAGGLCLLADFAYRRWAFGSWGGNGYAYWAPDFYAELWRTFNVRYPLESWDPTKPGNLSYYLRMITGGTHDFFSRYMAPAFAAATVGLLWPGRKGRPGWLLVLLLGGWGLVGVVFCLVYFFQSERFPHVWIVVIDMAVAWGLVRMPYWDAIRRRGLTRWGQGVALFAAAVLLRGEIMRVHGIHHGPDEIRRRIPYADQIRSLLDRVGPDAWLFSAYQPILVDRWRPHAGPTAGLYAWEEDSPMMNGHMMAEWVHGIGPRAHSADAQRYLARIPAGWRTGPSLLIDPRDQWALSEKERSAFDEPIYILTLTPFWPLISTEHQRDVVLPIIGRDWRLEPIQATADVTLYLARRRDIPSTATAAQP